MGNLDKIQKVGNWFSTILLGETKELIVRIDERTSRLAEDMRDIKPKVDSMSPKVDVLWDVWKNKYAPAAKVAEAADTCHGSTDRIRPHQKIVWGAHGDSWATIACRRRRPKSLRS